MKKAVLIIWRQSVTCFGWALLYLALSGGSNLAGEVNSFKLAGLKLLPKPWDKAGNFAKLEQFAQRAATAVADFIVTSEGYLEGYGANRKLSPPPTRECYLEVAESMDGPWI